MGTTAEQWYKVNAAGVLDLKHLFCATQDFEAVTPNLLARTIETVEGGGIVVLLLRTMNSLKQLYAMTMVSLEHHTSDFARALADLGITVACFYSGCACKVPDWGSSGCGGKVQWEVNTPQAFVEHGKIFFWHPKSIIFFSFSDLFCRLHPVKTVLSLTTNSTSCLSPATWHTSSLSLQRLGWLKLYSSRYLFI